MVKKDPIRVEQNAQGEWEVLNGLDEVLVREDTKREAVKGAKRWAMGDAPGDTGKHISHVKIYKANGNLQDAWWPPGNRQISVKPFSANDVKSEFSAGILRDFEKEGHSPPFWAVYITDADGDEQRRTAVAVKSRAVGEARDVYNERNAKRLSIYKKDWTVGRRLEHRDASA